MSPRKRVSSPEPKAPRNTKKTAKTARAATAVPPVPRIPLVVIEDIWPHVDGGRYPVKRELGDSLEVWADIFSHGHQIVRAWLLARPQGREDWSVRLPMIHDNNDRWRAVWTPATIGRWEYAIEAIRDDFFSWRQDFVKKYDDGQEVASEVLEGIAILAATRDRATGDDRRSLETIIRNLEKAVLVSRKELKTREIVKPHPLVDHFLLGEEAEILATRWPDLNEASQSSVFPLMVDRVGARYANWYEMFHRSQGTVEGKSANFDDMIRRLDYVAALGFDVIYLPPIHPIGYVNRKGPNDSTYCPPGAPGCPWAIGSHEGGHDAIHPDLGTLADFRRFIDECRRRGIEVAIDYAVQCAPDHPWVKAHPEWFRHRPDGSIKYAENPPKKYQDVYPINFEAGNTDLEGLWRELLRIVFFWIEQGVTIFRVDNPHTKPLHFWEWLIGETQRRHPEILFLSEAFTRPKVMKMLCKAGFSQTYTYFTWRNHKQELMEYFSELTAMHCKEYMRGNLFCNTPDILAGPLQFGPPSAFKMRASLAATLSSVWGIYNGFELCENEKNQKKEEYANSEKYQYKVWDWDRPGNIKGYIALLNRIRRENPALQEYDNLRFHHADNDQIIVYSKATADHANVVLTVVNLDPHHAHDSYVYLPVAEWGVDAERGYEVEDMVTGERWRWQGERVWVRLDPARESAHIVRIR